MYPFSVIHKFHFKFKQNLPHLKKLLENEKENKRRNSHMQRQNKKLVKRFTRIFMELSQMMKMKQLRLD